MKIGDTERNTHTHTTMKHRQTHKTHRYAEPKFTTPVTDKHPDLHQNPKRKEGSNTERRLSGEKTDRPAKTRMQQTMTDTPKSYPKNTQR